jgi:PIN domain nuclease of toxin-antitoxin system
LLDTNILIWAVAGSKRLSREARREIERAEVIFVSSASLWEISIKISLGKLEISDDELLQCLEAMGVEPLPITWEHARAVRQLPLHHRDPFDRMLIAQAISEPLVLLTHDEALLAYGDLIRVA